MARWRSTMDLGSERAGAPAVSAGLGARGMVIAVVAPAAAGVASIPLARNGPAAAIALFLLAIVIAAVAGGLWAGSARRDPLVDRARASCPRSLGFRLAARRHRGSRHRAGVPDRGPRRRHPGRRCGRGTRPGRAAASARPACSATSRRVSSRARCPTACSTTSSACCSSRSDWSRPRCGSSSTARRCTRAPVQPGLTPGGPRRRRAARGRSGLLRHAAGRATRRASAARARTSSCCSRPPPSRPPPRSTARGSTPAPGSPSSTPRRTSSARRCSAR